MLLKQTTNGFTLLEIMVVLIILGASVLVALPNFFNLVAANRAEEGKTKLQALLGAQKRYSIDHNGTYTLYLSDLDIDIAESARFYAPVASNNVLLNYVGRITSKDSAGTNDYTLYIQADGTMLCRSNGNICPKFGMTECADSFCSPP